MDDFLNIYFFKKKYLLFISKLELQKERGEDTGISHIYWFIP